MVSCCEYSKGGNIPLSYSWNTSTKEKKMLGIIFSLFKMSTLKAITVSLSTIIEEIMFIYSSTTKLWVDEIIKDQHNDEKIDNIEIRYSK